MGRVYFEQGRVKEAFDEINRALRGDSSLPQIWFFRGYMYWSLEDWTHAEQDFRAALERNPFYTDARMYLATSLDRRGLPDQALAELDRAAQDRNFATPEQIFLNKAVILRRQARVEEALAQLRTAVTLRPRFYRGHYEMAQVLVQLGRFEESEMAFEAAAPGYGKDAEFHYDWGEALFRMRRQDDAARELRRALSLGPGSEAAEKASRLLKQIS
jgi:Tfp pilus assembly protein PilF